MTNINKRAAIYVRVSTLEQAEHGYSIGEQIDKLKKYADIKDWHVYDVYSDGGFSGSNTHRPALERLTSDVMQRKFDTVLIYKLDRLSRSQKDTLHLIEDIFRPHNVDLVSMNENFDTSTPFGKAMIGILSVFAQLEREQIKERMALGKLGRAKTGKSMAWSKVPFGYTYDAESGNLVINELEARIVKQIYDEYLSGTSITKLRDKLNEEGHIGKDVKWTYRTVHQTLDNPIFSGMVRFKGQVYEGNHEGIVTPEIFQQTQIELEKRQKAAYAKTNNTRPFQSKYMLSGLIRCGYCGSPFEAILGSVRKDGTRLRKYQCVNRHKRGNVYGQSATLYNDGKQCKSGFYLMPDLENQVIDSIAKLQADESIMDEIIAAKQPEQIDHAPLEKRIKEIDTKLKKLSDLYMNDLITLEDLQEQTMSFKDEKKGLYAKLENNTNLEMQLTKERITKILRSSPIHTMTYEEQKKAVNQLIKKVDATAETMQIHWNF